MSGKGTISRRDLLINASAGLVAASLAGGKLLGSARVAAAEERVRKQGPVNTGHNILFVFTDQERHFDRWPRRLDLPGHERLARTGTYFGNHHIGATMCTSSRSIMMTGLQTAVNGDAALFTSFPALFFDELPKLDSCCVMRNALWCADNQVVPA